MSSAGEMPVEEKDDKALIGVIDAGTRTIRFAVFLAKTKEEILSHQVELGEKTPLEGWVEQDPIELLGCVRTCINQVISEFPGKELCVCDIATIGISNQRETTIVWNCLTGEPLYNAIVWSDIRTASVVDQILAKLPDNNKDYLKPLCGLPVSPYFSALKLRWLIDNIPAVRKAVLDHYCYFGTVDSWIIWNLTGGKDGGLHITDVTNASRTMLMNIDSLKWDPILCRHFNIPMDILPEIRSSSEIYGYIKDQNLDGICISGILGNQQAALVGQGCLSQGHAKNTYRSGCFLLYNTGRSKVYSTHGLVTTIAYQLGPGSRPIYALEGSVAIAGSAIEWLRDNLNMLQDISEIQSLAEEVMTTGDVYFVPAFHGLYAPYWRKDARGILCGLTQFTTKGHIIRAALEAVCFQTRDVLEAMHKDCGVPLTKLQVDGRMSVNNLLMQLQADLCGIPVVRTKVPDVTTLGAALIAGNAKGIDLINLNKLDFSTDLGESFVPKTTHADRDARYKKWKMAVQRSLGWAAAKKSSAMTDERYRLLASLPGTLFALTCFGLLVYARTHRK